MVGATTGGSDAAAGATAASTPTAKLIPTGVLDEGDNEVPANKLPQEVSVPDGWRAPLVWRNIIWFIYLHLGALYGLYAVFTTVKWSTCVFNLVMFLLGAFGVTVGAHRLWSHKAFKANVVLRSILMVFNTIAFENDIITWSRDHRVHHKYSETDADPHNAMRGFFFAHCGWLMCRKHPEVIRRGKEIDISDLYEDSVARFQRKYYMILMPILCFVLPTYIPVKYMGESFVNALTANFLRYTLTLHATWCVNSVAHLWGDRPFDRYINPSENLFVAIFAVGEGWHNYHHTFPWDYKTSETPLYKANWSTAFIDFFARIGWAWDLKVVPVSIIKDRVKRTGDGSHPVWGFGDTDMTKKDVETNVGTLKQKKIA